MHVVEALYMRYRPLGWYTVCFQEKSWWSQMFSSSCLGWNLSRRSAQRWHSAMLCLLQGGHTSTQMTLEIGGLSIYTYLTPWPYLMVVGLALVFHCCCCCRNCLPFSALAFNQPEPHVLPINLSRVDKPKWHKECNGEHEGNLHSGNLT